MASKTAPRRSVLTTSENFAALQQQVIGLDTDYQELKGVVVSLDRKMEHGFTAIHTKLDERNRTQWPVIFSGLAVLLTFCVSIGTLAYWPIKSELAAVKEDAVRLAEREQTIQREFDFLRGQLHQQLK